MPIYEYRCKKGHTLEVLQRMSDDALTKCTTCGAAVQRVFHPVAVHFKGSGFYNTDYGTRSKNNDDAKKKDDAKKADGKSKSDSDSSSSKDKSDKSTSASKSDGTKKAKASADSKSAS
jgi:putative FmdB family regulatory protein